MNQVITIARQYGSGGREIGMKLSQKLGVPFYDRELITMSVEKSGYDEEVLRSVDEKAASSLLYTLAMGSTGLGVGNVPNIPINDRLFVLQSEVIRELADKGPCIIVGRCADYVLREHADVKRVFVYAGFSSRIDAVMRSDGLDERKAKDKIVKTDRRRAEYYSYYTGQKWGRLENYDVMIASDKFGIDGTVDALYGLFCN